MFKIFEHGQKFFEHVQNFSTHSKFFEHVQKFLDRADGQGIIVVSYAWYEFIFLFQNYPTAHLKTYCLIYKA